MRFNLKLNEVQYIQKQFYSGSLLGVEKRLFPLFGVKKTLKRKGIIIERDGREAELSDEYYSLFSTWEKMRYLIDRQDSDMSFRALANERTIILVDQVGDDIAIELFDFRSNTLDNILLNTAGFDLTVSAENPFSISLSVEDFIQLTASHKNGNVGFWSRKLGVSKEDLTSYLDMMNKEEDIFTYLCGDWADFMYVCEDHLEQGEILTMVVKAPKGYYALKHITPKDSTNERMVMIVGNAQTIANSIWNEL